MSMEAIVNLRRVGRSALIERWGFVDWQRILCHRIKARLMPAASALGLGEQE